MSAPSAPQTIDDVIARLTEVIDTCRADESRIGYFAALYRRITIAVKGAIAAGKFEDGPRMERLDVVFASRYLDALAAYRRGEPAGVWAPTFQAARSPVPLVMQHLLMAVNAHVDFDLGVAAATVAPGASIDALKGDFFTLNGILAGQVDIVRGELAEINVLLKLTALFAPVEDKLVDLAVDVGRDHAWRFATGLAAATPDQRAALLASTSRHTMDLGRFVRSPGLLVPVLWLLRIFERGTVGEKIAMLAR